MRLNLLCRRFNLKKAVRAQILTNMPDLFNDVQASPTYWPLRPPKHTNHPKNETEN